MIKKLLWIIWAPLILVGLVLLSLGLTFVFSMYSVNYAKDEYVISKVDYDELEKFEVTTSYELIRDDSLDLIANKVNYHIEKILGNKLETKNTISGGSYIELKVDETLATSYEFKSIDNINITITGNNKEHLLRGAYAFLEEFGGYTCYTLNVYESKTGRIVFPIKEGGYTKTYTDFFEYRDIDWLSSNDCEYSYFRGYNSTWYRFHDEDLIVGTTKTYGEVKDELGQVTRYIVKNPHSIAGEWCNSDKYYDSHPEYFALDQSGNRIKSNVCLSCDETFETIKNEVLERLENEYDPNGGLQLVTVTQPDDLTGCKCSECVKKAKEHGGYAYNYLSLVNYVADAVKDAGYDKVELISYAYRYTRACPVGIVPKDNVVIRLCSIECCQSHYIDDPKCIANKNFMKDLEDWSEVAPKIHIWDYTANYSHFMNIFPNIETMAHNIRVYFEHNVVGIYEEGNYNYDETKVDNEFAELRAYVVSKVLEDPYCDYLKEIRDFCNAYYGEGGEDIFNFITKIDAYARRRHLNIYNSPETVIIASFKELNELNDLFEHAKEVTVGETKSHVLLSEMSWKYYKLFTKQFEYKGLSKEEYIKAKENYFIEQSLIGHTDINECGDEAAFRNSILQEAIVDLAPLWGLVTHFIYGP